MDLNECYKKGFIKKTKINRELINSLIEISNIKEETINSARLNERNISAYVSMAYESLREILEAICISKGYKINSHLCLGEFLKKLLKNFDFNEFDRLRYIRNGINYYGTQIEFKQGKEIIQKIFSFKKNVLKELK